MEKMSMDISERLEQLSARLAAHLSVESLLCKQAAAHIRNEERYIRELKAGVHARYDQFLAAALQGILANNTVDPMWRDKQHCVQEAHTLALWCMQRKPEEE
jgi:hypothetical protein